MFYATFLTVVIILLAIGFLLSGLVVLYRHRGLSQPRQIYGIPRRGMKFTPILVIVLPTILVFAWVATASFASPPAAPSPAVQLSTATPTSATTITPPQNLTLITPGTLTVGVGDSNSTSPPEIYYDNNSPAGFDIELIKAIAGEINLKVNPIPTPADQLLNGLRTKKSDKKFDVMISAYTLTDPINAEFLGVPYLVPKDVLFVAKGNPKNVNFDNGLTDNGLTDLCGHTIGVQDLSLELTALKKTNCSTKSPLNIVKLTKVDDVANALINKQQNVEAIYQSTPTASYYKKNFHDDLEQVGTSVQLPQEGILIRQGNQDLKNAIQNALNGLIRNGQYANLLKSPMGDLSGDAVKTQ